jgi:hypothetical protein
LFAILIYFLLKNTKATILESILYGLLAVWTLVEALKGRALFRKNFPQNNETVYRNE